MNFLYFALVFGIVVANPAQKKVVLSEEAERLDHLINNVVPEDEAVDSKVRQLRAMGAPPPAASASE
jgi:hypothetical protein